MFDLDEFSKINRERCEKGFNHSLASWYPHGWTNAIAGEAGEACNIAKKILRILENLPGNTKANEDNEEYLKEKLAEELADVMIYADLAIQALGRNSSEVIETKFNKTSKKIGSGYNSNQLAVTLW